MTRAGCWLGLAALLLAGCASRPATPPPAAEAAPPLGAEQMLADTLAGTPLPASLMRDDQRLSYAVQQPGKDGADGYLAQLDASCDGSSARLIYLEGAQRVYLGSKDGKYAAPTSIPGKYLDLLKRNAAFQQACTQTAKPDWRLAHGTAKGSQILIDRASLASEAGVTRFWGAYDEPQLGHDKPYNAPVAQKREHYAVDCAQQNFSLLAAYDVDDKQTVTDGKVFDKQSPMPVAKAHVDYRLLFDLVCNKPDKLAKLPAFSARSMAPAEMKMPGVTPAVLTAIKRLGLQAPSKSLKHVVLTGTTSLKGKAGELHEEQFFDADKATGQLVVRTRGQAYEGSSVTFRGLFPLAEQTRFESDGQTLISNQQLLGLTLSGDWWKLPVGEKLSYTSVGITVNSAAGTYGRDPTTVHCEVADQAAASTLNPSLTGDARKLRCTTDGDEYKRVETVYYLVDYGWFFKAGVDKNAFYDEERRIVSVE